MKKILFLLTVFCLTSCPVPGHVSFRKDTGGKWRAFEVRVKSDDVRQHKVKAIEDRLNGR